MVLKNGLKIIFWITFFVSGSAWAVFGVFKYMQSERIYDSRYHILAIMQSSSEKETLNTAYLAEILSLSVDQPTNIYRFNTAQATAKLVKSPLLKKAGIEKIYPGTIHIRYVLRMPIAFLADFTNIALDKEGVAIPFKPFFTPKILPSIYLGIQEEVDDQFLGKKIQTKEAKLALKLLDYLSSHLVSDHLTLKRIDVSDSYASSYGQKQIVVVVEESIEKMKGGQPFISHQLITLRLSPNRYQEEIKKYLTLSKYLLKKELASSSLKVTDSKVIDLRIPKLAFLSKGE